MDFARIGAWVALVLAAVFFLTTGGTYPGIASVDAHVIGQALGLLVLGGWLVLALVRPAWRPTTPLLLPVALVSGTYLMSAIASQRPRLSLEPTIAGLGWALAFLFLTRLLAHPWFRARAAVLMTAFVVVVAAGYIAQVLVEWWSWWQIIGRVAVPPLRPSFAALFLGSPNLIATALLLLAPLVVVRQWTRPAGRGIAIAIGLAAGIAFFLTGSRGAYLGAVAGGLVALALTLAHAGRAGVASAARRARSQRMFLVPVGVALLAGLVFAPSLLLRIAQGGGTLRLDLWRSAIAIFEQHPMLGSGPGTWVQLKVAANPPGVPNLILPHAHDLYVQAAAELGVLGLIALTALALAVLRRVWEGWQRTGRDGAAGRLGLESGAVLVSVGAYAGQSLVDNLVNLPFVCLLLAAIVAWVDGGLANGQAQAVPTGALTRGIRHRLQGGPALPVLGLVAMAITVPTLVRIDRAAYLNADGDRAAVDGHWQLALDAYNGARTEDPGFTLYELQAAAALSRIGRTPEAKTVLAHAIEADPLALNVIGLAALETELGEADAARGHIKQAIALGPGEAVIALNAGLLAERLGDPALALEQFATAVAMNPPLIRSGLWVAPPRVASRQEVANRARAFLDSVDGALVLAYAGDLVAARAELERAPPSGRRDVYLAATQWLGGDPDGALRRLDGILAADPNDWFAAAWAARISLQEGDAASQKRYSDWAMTVQGDAAPSVINEVSSVPPGPHEVSVNLPGTYPWAVYLRPVSPYPTVRELVLIGGG